VVARLRRGQVDAVLLVDDQSSSDTLWIAPTDPMLVSVDDHVLREAGVDDPQKPAPTPHYSAPSPVPAPS
jgi:hypothetical protein